VVNPHRQGEGGLR